MQAWMAHHLEELRVYSGDDGLLTIAQCALYSIEYGTTFPARYGTHPINDSPNDGVSHKRKRSTDGERPRKRQITTDPVSRRLLADAGVCWQKYARYASSAYANRLRRKMNECVEHFNDRNPRIAEFFRWA